MSTQQQSEIIIPEGLDVHCPIYAQTLRNYKTLEELRNNMPIEINIEGGVLDLSHARYCLVGEKYGFTTDYYIPDRKVYCETCERFSLWFLTLSIDSFNNRLKEFVKHCNEAHPVLSVVGRKK